MPRPFRKTRSPHQLKFEGLEDRRLLTTLQPGQTVEAESGALVGSMAIANDAAASGGSFVAGQGYYSAPTDNYVEFDLDVPSAGLFALDARVSGAGGGSDSFFITVDDQPVDGHIWDFPAGVGFTADRVSSRANGGDDLILDLEAGISTLRFHVREQDARLDTVTLVALGGSVFSIGQTVEAEAGTLSGSMFIGAEPNASGGQYVAGNGYASNPGNNFVEFVFDVTTAGDYTLDTQVSAATASNDSFFVTIDDEPATGHIWDVPEGLGYVATQVVSRGVADPLVLSLTPGQHTVRFHLREEDTRLDTVRLEPVDGSPAFPTSQTIEAELGTVSGSVSVRSDGAASGGQYVAGDGYASQPGTNYVEFEFDVPTAGNYTIETRVSAPTDTNDSFFVTVDDQPLEGHIWDIPEGLGYVDDTVSSRGVTDTLMLTLTEGLHTVRFSLREPDARLDTVRLEPVVGSQVFGTNQSIEAEFGTLAGSMSVRDDLAASCGQYVAGDGFASSPGDDYVEFVFDVPSAASFTLDAFVYAENTSSDSFFVTVDGAPATGYIWDLPESLGYVADQVSDRGVGTVELALTQGLHTVRFHLREDGARLDSVRLSEIGAGTPGQFSFAATNYTVDESSASVQVQVDRVGGADGTVSVEYATVDQSTTQLEDYVPVVGRLTFGDGQTSMLVTVPIIQDPFVEGDETFAIQLSNPTGGATLGTNQTIVTIADDDETDPAGLFRFSQPMYAFDEGIGQLSVTVVRDNGSSGAVSVDYLTYDDAAVAGLDYTAVSGTLNFADGQTESTITIPILEDNLAEPTELFWLGLRNPTNGAAVVVSDAQLMIQDNEPASGSGEGLYGQYFDNIDFTGLERVQIDSRIAFNFGNGSPSSDIEAETFSIRWTGRVEALFSETYTFETRSDDGVRLWVDNQLIIDNWTDHAPTTNTGTIALQAGELTDIRLEYYENSGGALIELVWSSPSQSREFIPQTQLYSDGYYQRGESTYLLTPDQMTWSEAQNYARRLGGNLVTVNDANEYGWLQQTFGTDLRLWIGLNDEANEGNFVWASGEPVTYTNWASNEPNNGGGNQDYATMNFGSANQWDDDSATSQYFGVIEVTGTTVPSQNAIFGVWDAPIPMPNIAVAAAQMPDGEIVTWSSWDRFNFGGNNPQTYTSVFNTATRQVQEFLVTDTQHDMFCPGTVMLSDGRILVNGGGSTVTSTSIYDFRTNTWSRIENMNIRRWYNSSVTLGDGRVLTWGGNAPDGHASPAEVWEDGVGWQIINGMDINIYLGTGDQTSWHPQMFQAPNGRVFIAGPGPNMYWADLDDAGSVLEFAGTRPDGYSQHGSYIMYEPGKILKFGGADQEANSGVVTDRAFIIDITGPSPVVTETGTMNSLRKFVNGVMLPDGRVMAVGGNTSGNKFSDAGSVYFGEIWDPATGEWSVVDAMDVPRNYHSVALLQQDGTVFAAGGGLCGSCAANHSDAQIYNPAYLYEGDGTLASRPAITANDDQLGYGQTLNVNIGGGQSIANFNLIRMSTVTHSINTDHRFVPLSFTDQGGGNYALTMPASGNVAPPGYYMLFAIADDGTPSEAHVIRVS